MDRSQRPRLALAAWFVTVLIGMVLRAPACLEAKPRFVDLLRELEEARIVTRARILSYDPEGLRFQPLPEPSTPMTVNYSDDQSYVARPSVVPDEGEASVHTGLWPPAGAEVLVVVDQRNIVSLFAQLETGSSPHLVGDAQPGPHPPEADDADSAARRGRMGWRSGRTHQMRTAPETARYRFWSPVMTLSVALFTCTPPAQPLDRDESGIGRLDRVSPEASSDGCWLPASSVMTRGVDAATP